MNTVFSRRVFLGNYSFFWTFKTLKIPNSFRINFSLLCHENLNSFITRVQRVCGDYSRLETIRGNTVYIIWLGFLKKKPVLQSSKAKKWIKFRNSSFFKMLPIFFSSQNKITSKAKISSERFFKQICQPSEIITVVHADSIEGAPN